MAVRDWHAVIDFKEWNRQADAIGLLPRDSELYLEIQKLVASNYRWMCILMLAIGCIVISGCREHRSSGEPYIEFTSVPLEDEGGPDKLDVIGGQVIGARPGLQIVLFARSGAWYVQPLANEPFTQIQSDSTWRSPTHLGTEYAALLVEQGYQPPPSTDVLPGEGEGVVAVAVIKGEPVFWKRWWFLLLCVLASMSALLAFYSYRLHQATKQLKLRFEGRLAERTQVAQELHDTLLQGVISASMHLHIAVDHLPEDFPARGSFAHVLQVMGRVVDEGQNALQRLRSPSSSDPLDLEQSFSRIQQEFAVEDQVDFRITVEGRPRLLHPIIRDEVYRIGREALVNAFRHSRAHIIEVEVKYGARQLRAIIRDDGSAIDPQSLRSGWDDPSRFSDMRERAQAIGARLKVRSRAAIGTEVELTVPGDVAFQNQSSKSLLRWLYARSGSTETSQGGK